MPWDRNQMAARAAQELEDGMYVNLGIGIPTLVANYVGDKDITLQSENGMLGMGPFPFEGDEDPDLINAGKQTITELSGRLTSTARPALHDLRRQDCGMISVRWKVKGDLANWMIPACWSLHGRRDGSGRRCRPRGCRDGPQNKHGDL